MLWDNQIGYALACLKGICVATRYHQVLGIRNYRGQMQARIVAARRDAEMSGGQMQARIIAARRDAEMSGERMQARIAATSPGCLPRCLRSRCRPASQRLRRDVCRDVWGADAGQDRSI